MNLVKSETSGHPEDVLFFFVWFFAWCSHIKAYSNFCFSKNLESKLASCRDFVYDTSVNRAALQAAPGIPAGLEGRPDVPAASLSSPPQYDR